MIEENNGEIRIDNPVSPVSHSACAGRSGVVAVIILVAIILFLSVMGVLGGYGTGVVQVSGSSGAQGDLVRKVEALEARLAKIELAGTTPAKGAEVSSPVSAPSNSVDTQDMEKLKLGLAGLSNALAVLQGELERTAKAQTRDSQTTQTGLSTLLAFVMLQRAAHTSHPFEIERLDLRKAVGEDQTLVDALIKLEPYAISGVPTAQGLLKEWGKVSAEAQAALRKAGAQTWFDRLVVGIEGLVSIRSLSPSMNTSLLFSSIAVDLENGNPAAAMEKTVALPEGVQTAISAWKAKLEARVAVDKSVQNISAYLMNGARQSATAAEPVQAPASAPDVEKATTPKAEGAK